MERTRIAIAMSVLALLVGSCGGSADPPEPPEPTAQESAGSDEDVTVERTLPCDAVAPIAAALIGQVDTSSVREPGERFAPVPGARKVAEATYFCGWSNDHADAVLRIYPDPLTGDQAVRVWEARTGQTAAYGGGQCTRTLAGWGDASLGVVCAYGPQRSVLQVLGLFGDSLVECWHTRIETEPAALEEEGMAFCQEIIDLIGVTAAAS